MLLPVPLPPRLDLVVRVRPPRRRLRLLRVGGSGVAGAAASSEWRGAAGGGEETTLPPAGRDERGRPRLEWEWELELPLQRQGHHRVGGQRGEAGAGAECGGQIYEARFGIRF